MPLPTVNKKLFPPKAHYFLYFGGVAAFWPYISVFGKQLGLLESQVGYIFTVAPIAGIISMPLFGSIADRFKIKKKLFLFFNVINLLAILCFAFLTETETKIVRPVGIECGTGTSFVKHVHSGDTEWNSTAVRTKIVENLSNKDFSIICQVDCYIEKREAEQFCDAIFNRGHEPLAFCLQNISADNAAFTTFNAKMDFLDMMFLENQLYVKILTLAELDGGRDAEYRGLSCSPRRTIQQCQINCPDLPAANSAMETVGSLGDQSSVLVFVLYAVFTIIAWIAMAVVTSVADALCFQTLGDRSDLYGAQRKWGSVGWGLFTLLSGFLVDLVSGSSVIKNYSPCYYIAAVLLTLNFIVCWKWDVEEEERPKALSRRMVTLIVEPKITVFILICVVVGICTGLQWNFLFWYIEDLAHARAGDESMEAGKWIKLLQGLVSIVQCFGGELPFFYLAGKFLNKFGHVNSMAIVIGTFGVRFILYSMLVNPWLVLPIELLQGLTYGIFYANMATYAYVVSPEGTAATVQGIVGSAFEGVGVSLGSLIGGLMFQHMSGRSTFRIFGVFSLVMCVLYKGVMMTIDRKFEPLSQRPGNNDLNDGTELKKIERQQASA